MANWKLKRPQIKNWLYFLQPSGSIDTLNDVNSDDLYVNTMLFDYYDDFDEEYFDDLQVINW